MSAQSPAQHRRRIEGSIATISHNARLCDSHGYHTSASRKWDMVRQLEAQLSALDLEARKNAHSHAERGRS